MKYGTFLFTEMRDPADDGRGIHETLAEARLSEELGMDAVWLAEHHFDGACAYVDPVAFAAAVAVATERVKIGFAVVQATLQHPVHLAEQCALVDQLSRGRLIVGLGRGSNFNIYEAKGFGVPFEEAQERLEELEPLLVQLWEGRPVSHAGKHWSFDVAPGLRPQPYTRPHPPICRSVGSEGSTWAEGLKGRPILLPPQPDAMTKARAELLKASMQEAGFGTSHVADALANSWVWRHVVIAEDDAEARRIGLETVAAMMAYRVQLSPEYSYFAAQAAPKPGELPAGLICGSPETVIAQFKALEACGLGGGMLRFRIGPMAADVAERSLRLFATKVRPVLDSTRQSGGSR